MIVLTLIIAIFSLLLGYIFYGRFVAKKLRIDDTRSTPAHTMYDNVDYCPAKPPILFGHHFASIAGAAPIIGPIIAATYGWLPVFIWVIIGGIFLGAVHDFSTLVASIRHCGRSIGEVIGFNIGYLGRQLFLIFLWATLVLLIAVFVLATSKTFISTPSAGTSSGLFIVFAIIFGLTVYRWRAPVWLATLVGVIFLTFALIAGWHFPLVLSNSVWIYTLLAYILIASVAPVWILLQPRDYLNSFLLFAVLVVSIVGIFVANPVVQIPMFTHFMDPNLGPLFPVLFVTVACGAISGFHSVVASGTTAKQIDRESDAKKIGFGAMLVESLLAVIALITAMILTNAEYLSMLSAGGPITIFSNGAGKIISSLGFPLDHATSFAALAVSAFVLTSLDTATRLARYAFQEFFAPRDNSKPSILNRNRYIGTLVTVVLAGLLVMSEKTESIWPIFGSANQLLAALALLAVTIWLRRDGVRAKFTCIPMVIMFVITISALATLVITNAVSKDWEVFSIGLVLLVIAGVLVVETVAKVKNFPLKERES